MNQDQMMYSPPKYGGIIKKKYIQLEDPVTYAMDPQQQTMTHGGKYDPVLVVPQFDTVA
jgi:hypothetical protein